MKRTEKLLGMVLAAALVLSLLLPAIPAVWAESGTAGSVRWSMDSNGVLTVSGSGAIPDYQDGYDAPWPRHQVTAIRVQSGVTAIGAHAFDDCYKATSVEIGDTVTSIGDEAFKYCGKLTSVRLPSATTVLGEGVFMECSRLEEILVDNRNTAFISRDGVLYDRGATRLVLCPAARAGSYTVAETVTEIGSCAFFGCAGLTEINLPDSVSTIGDWAFFCCTGLPSLELPAAVRTIGTRAFVRCDVLSTLALPDELTSIGDEAFQYSGLTTITIPASAVLGEDVFTGCGNLESIHVAAGSTRYSSRDGVLFDRDQTTLLLYPAARGGSYTIPATVTAVGDRAFIGSQITAVTIPDSVRTLGEGAFSRCQNLISVQMGGGLTEITRNAFCFCTALESFTVPAGVKSVGQGAFSYCDSLRRVMLAKSVTSVGSYAFLSCHNLSELDLGGAVTIGESAFSNCDGLESLTLPDAVRSVGREAFYGCDQLRTVFFGSGLEGLDSRSFANCPALEAYVCTGVNPNYATENGLLYSADYTRLIRVPVGFRGVCAVKGSVTDVDELAFSDCCYLTGAVLGDKVRTIGNLAFTGCLAMHRVALGKALTDIGEGAFGNHYAMNLQDVWFTGTDEQWLAVSVGENNDALDRAALHLVTVPVMAFQPDDVTVKEGETAVFSAAALGGDVTEVQWYYRSADGTVTGKSSMTGFDTGNLRVNATLKRDGQQYRMEARLRDGTVLYSDWATLHVTADFALTAQPQDAAAKVGETATFTVIATGADLTYQWQHYTGSKWIDSDMPGNRTAALSVPVTAARNGQRYRCAITNGAGEQLLSDPATLTVLTAVTKQPHNITAPIGDSAWFKVEATGAGLAYQWQYKTTESGAVWKNSGMPGNRETVLKIPVTAPRNGQQYRCVITDANGKETVTAAVKLLVKPVITDQPKPVSAGPGETVRFTVQATGAGLRYQWQFQSAGSTVWENSGLSGAKSATLTMIMGASRDGTRYRCVITDANGAQICSTAVKLLVKPVITDQPKPVSASPGETVRFTVRATGAGLRYQWQFQSAGSTVWENSGLSGAKSATLTMIMGASRNGTRYRCVITGANGAQICSAAVKLLVKPVITGQPKSVSARPGETVRFNVQATGEGLRYQWQFQSAGSTVWKNSGLSGAKSATLTMIMGASRNGTRYRCVVTDANGKSVISTAATLTVK